MSTRVLSNGLNDLNPLNHLNGLNGLNPWNPWNRLNALNAIWVLAFSTSSPIPVSRRRTSLSHFLPILKGWYSYSVQTVQTVLRVVQTVQMVQTCRRWVHTCNIAYRRQAPDKEPFERFEPFERVRSTGDNNQTGLIFWTVWTVWTLVTQEKSDNFSKRWHHV